MIVEMRKGATPEEIDAVAQRAKSLGLEVQMNLGTDKTVVAILGSNTGKLQTDIFAVLPGVETVTRIMKPYKLASREFQSENAVVNVGGVEVGGNRIVVMAGPCAVESESQLARSAEIVKAAGARILRGGAFKPRTSPFSFQGLKQEGLELLARVAAQYGMPVISEVTDTQEVAAMAEHCDILQVGSRNMQNFVLLSAVGKSEMPGGAQAGLLLHGHRMAHGRGLRSGRRQQPGHTLRTRHQDFRRQHPLFTGYLVDTGHQEGKLSAADRRPQPRRRTLRPGPVAGQGRHRGRRRRPADRGAPESERGARGRPAVADAIRLRPADEGTQADRRRP